MWPPVIRCSTSRSTPPGTDIVTDFVESIRTAVTELGLGEPVPAA
jgi:hypothetical protein